MSTPRKAKASKKAQAKLATATSRPGWLTVRNEADSVEMLINGPIGKSWWDSSGVASNEFRNELSKVPKGRKVTVRINSEGGSVGDALEIYNILRERGDDVTTINDGYAISSASVILCAGGRVICPQSSILMIHEPWSMTQGDQEQHQRAAEMLDTHGKTIASIYAERTGMTEDEARAMMKKETWMTGDEAVEMGFADEDDAEEASTENRFSTLNLDGYRNIPTHVMNRLRPEQTPVPTAAVVVNNEISAVNVDGGQTPQATKQTSVNMPKENETVAAVPANASNDLAAAIERERKARVTAEVKRRAENKVPNASLAFYIDSAMQNEEATFAAIDALPVSRPGGEPVGAPPVDAGSAEHVYEVPNASVMAGRVLPRAGKRLDFMVEARKLPSATARIAALKRDWTGKMNAALVADSRANGGSTLPQNSNTYSSTLITDFLVDQAITQLQNRWAALSCFTRDFSVDRFKPLATGQVKLVTAGATTLVATKGSGITNFESGDSTVTNIPVAMQHYSQPFHVSQDELMSGLRLENLTSINLAVLADTIVGKALSPIASSTFSAGTYYALSGTFGWDNEMPDLRGYLKKSPIKNAILDGPFFSRLTNRPGFYQSTFTGERDNGRAATFGWDNIEENTQWSTAPTNVSGFLCNPQAIAVIAGLPMVPPNIPGAVLQESVIMIPGPDISIAAYVWFSLASRTLWTSYDVVFGAAAGDTTAGAVLYKGAGPRS